MSFHVFFGMSNGLSKPIRAPRGTLQEIRDHVAHVEAELGITWSKYQDNPEHWNPMSQWASVDDEVLCREAERHNRYVRWLYDRLEEWDEKSPADGEEITPEQAAEFWRGLELIDVPLERWTSEYYCDRMQALYEVMRGREAEGMTFDAKPLSVKQAAAVIRIFDQYLDAHDMQLDVPRGHDYLASSVDGGYEWCDKCGAPIHPDEECRHQRAERLREEKE